jgi:hypothetical protein
MNTFYFRVAMLNANIRDAIMLSVEMPSAVICNAKNAECGSSKCKHAHYHYPLCHSECLFRSVNILNYAKQCHFAVCHFPEC